MEAEDVSSTSPFKQIMRSLRSRLKMSCVCQPPPTVSVTKGMGNAAVDDDDDDGDLLARTALRRVC